MKDCFGVRAPALRELSHSQKSRLVFLFVVSSSFPPILSELLGFSDLRFLNRYLQLASFAYLSVVAPSKGVYTPL